MIAIIFFILSGFIMNADKEVFVFNSPETSGEWRIINDVVMGGISKSSFNLSEDGSAIFSGTLSPDNNGGFASVRAYVENSDLEDFTGVIIKTKGDGNIYNLRFRTDQNYDGVSYQAKFKSDNSVWTEHKISFKDFIPTFRGRKVSNKPELKSENIRQIGILIADKQWGEFELDIKWIKFY
jgi:NADH dehydrogenase [ubiquinone] 1 alpha subcomplex assembly factor 1